MNPTFQHVKQGALALAVATAVGTIALIASPGASQAQNAPPQGDGKDAKAPTATKVKPALSVSVVQAQSSELPVRISANGNVAAWQEASLGAEANGLRLAAVNVNVGDRVRKGQVLALFAAETVQAEVAQARASLAEAEASLVDAKANAERARSIQASGALSAQQVTQLLTGEKTAEARVAAAKAQLNAAEVRLSHTQVLAPDAGTISARSATVGAVAQPGQELFRLIRNDRIEWRAEVTSAEIAKVRPGQSVSVVSATGAKAEGKVRMVAPTVDPQTRNALVYVDLPASATQSGAFKAGMFARGEFVLGASAALTVPQTALSLRDGFSYVFTVGPDNKVSQVKVQVGRRLGDKVEVAGIKASDRVVASGSSFLSDGDLVKVVSK
jgi:RND family efflux transporter MFP subunit